jgi:hypothetical protein
MDKETKRIITFAVAGAAILGVLAIVNKDAADSVLSMFIRGLPKEAPTESTIPVETRAWGLLTYQRERE